MPTPPESTRHSNLTKLLVLLPLRANSKSTFQHETPCSDVLVSRQEAPKIIMLLSSFTEQILIHFENVHIILQGG